MRISDWSSDVCSSDLSDRYFNERFVDVLLPLIRASSGGVLILCTTLRAVDRIAELLEERFEDEGNDRVLLLQGESSRRALLELFREIGRAAWRERVCQYWYIPVVASS